MARVQDPHAECTCDTLSARLEELQDELRHLKEEHHHANTWWHALRETVEQHPERDAILAETRRRRGW